MPYLGLPSSWGYPSGPASVFLMSSQSGCFGVLCLFCCLCLFAHLLNRVFLGSPSCPRSHSNPSASASWVPGSQVLCHTHGCYWVFEVLWNEPRPLPTEGKDSDYWGASPTPASSSMCALLNFQWTKLCHLFMTLSWLRLLTQVRTCSLTMLNRNGNSWAGFDHKHQPQKGKNKKQKQKTVCGGANSCFVSWSQSSIFNI